MSSSTAETSIGNSTLAPSTLVILTGPTIGSGPDTLSLVLSQDYWQGSAQFNVDVNGIKIDGVQTLDPSLLNSAGGTEIYTLKGDFSSVSGTDTIKLNYLNNAWGGTASTDRNLYVNGITLDGKATSSAIPTELYITESKSFTVSAPIPAPAPSPTPVNITGPAIGSGPDTLDLTVSQDYWQGSAQFTVDVNGIQIGSVQTVNPSVLNSVGGTETYTMKGYFGSASGSNTIHVNFLNDAWGGTVSTDRNLYVNNISLDGKATSSAMPTELNITEGKSSAVAAPTPAPAPVHMTGPTIGSGPDTLSLDVSQDYRQGSAQFIVDVNGHQIGGVQTVDPSVLHTAGGIETFALKGNFTSCLIPDFMVRYFPWNGRKHYGPSSSRLLHNDSGGPSSDTA